jgi:hypothetical protein
VNMGQHAGGGKICDEICDHCGLAATIFSIYQF